MSKAAERREQFYADVICIAIEDGGLNAWRQVGEYHCEHPASTRAVIMDLVEGGEHKVSADIMARGFHELREAIQRGVCPVTDAMRLRLRADDQENEALRLDSYDADAVLQLGLFGEVKYG